METVNIRTGWIDLPEHRPAAQALGQVQACLRKAGSRRTINPVFLHGPAGSGKSHLVNDFLLAVSADRPDLVVRNAPASELLTLKDEEERRNLREVDLWIIEDVQHLRSQAVEWLVALFDRALARQQQLLFTANLGPAQLIALPVRLTSRLAQGLVVMIDTLSVESRRLFLRECAAQRGMTMTDEVLDWLATRTPGSVRQLEGALNRVETLQRSLRQAVGLEHVEEVFSIDAQTRKLTLEKIVRQVGVFYQVDPDQLCSQRRSREVLVPRQVSMYLARLLTNLPLEQIGAYFGGRDHTTVLHACRKIEDSLPENPTLKQAIRQLSADLG